MTLLPFLAAALATAVLALATVHWRRGEGAALALVGLVIATILAILLPTGPSMTGGTEVAIDAYLRLVAVLGCAMGVGLAGLAAMIHARQADAERGPAPVAGVVLAAAVTLGSGTIALALPPAAAALPAGLAGIAAMLGLVVLTRDESNVTAGRQLLRAVVLAGSLLMVGAAVALGAAPALDGQPLAAGSAALALLAAVGLRTGAIPFHASVARIVPRAGLVAPFVLIWAAIPLVATASAVIATGIAPLTLPLGPERGLIVVFAAVTLFVAPVVAAITDDLDHVVAYAIVQDMGLLVLAFAASDPAWEPIRSWLLIIAASKTALIAWSVAMRSTYGSARLSDLHGWAIHAPLLAAALALIAVATVGIPTLAVAGVRRDIADAVLDEPLASAAFLAGLLALVPYLRLAAVGLSSPSPLVRRAPSERLRPPTAWLDRARAATVGRARSSADAAAGPGGRGLANSMPRDPAADRAAARVADIAREFAIGANRGNAPAAVRGRPTTTELAGDAGARRPSRAPRRPLTARLALLAAEVREAWRINLVPLTAGLVLLLAGLSFLVSAGGFDLRAASAAGAPEPVAIESPAPSGG